MRKSIYVFVCMIVMQSELFAQSSYSLDFKDPENIVNAIFYAANSKDFDILNNLLDPWLENDELTENISLMVEQEMMDQFCKSFKNGKISGEIVIMSLEDEVFAILPVEPIHYFPDITAYEDIVITKIILVKRYDNWFLWAMYLSDE